jgi:hypothetical protein
MSNEGLTRRGLLEAGIAAGAMAAVPDGALAALTRGAAVQERAHPLGTTLERNRREYPRRGVPAAGRRPGRAAPRAP